MDIIKVHKRYFFNFIFLPLFFSGKIPEVVWSTTSGIFHILKKRRGLPFFYLSFSLIRSAMVMPSKKSLIILSSFSHIGSALQHSALEQAAAP